MLTSEKKLHVLFIFFFLIIAIFLTLGRVGTAFRSFALVTQDLGVYASFAAAQDHPELFTRDPFLSDQKNINSYNMIEVPLIKALQRVFGNYGTACAFLLPFFIFVHLMGYYVLGVSIFKNAWAGFLVSLLLSAPAHTVYDYWGLILDALPRFLYQGMLPFLLALSIWRGHQLRWWPVILGGIGLLNYVHPLSTPAWTVATMFALWISTPKLGFWEKARALGLGMIVLLLVLSPFVINYVSSTILETSHAAYDETLAILQARFATMSGSNPLSALAIFFEGRRGFSFDPVWYLVWLLGILGAVFGLIWQKGSEANRYSRQIAAWLAGVLIVSGFVPVLEQAIFAYLKRIPPEFEILRTLRYLTPLILLAAFHGLWLAKNYLQEKGVLSPTVARYGLVGASVLFLLLWGGSNESQRPEFRDTVKQNVSCWRQGKIICPLPPASMDLINVLNVIREQTPVGSRIFSEGQETAVRYYALRPLVFSFKDGAALAYTDQKQLLIWKKEAETMDELAFLRKFLFRHKAFVKEMIELARNTQSDYLLLQEPYNADLEYPEPLNLIYTNAHYSLYKLNP